MTFLDKGSKRDLRGSVVGKAIYYFAALLAAYGAYSSVFSHPHAIVYRGVFVAALLAMVFLRYSRAEAKNKEIQIVDYALAILSLMMAIFIIFSAQRYVFRVPFYDSVTTMDFVVGFITVILVLEATRRAIGAPLMIVAVILLFYPFFGKYIPGMFGHRGFSLQKVVEQLFMTTNGIFGEAVGICTSYVLLFVIFGEFLNSTGGGDFFFDLSNAVTGTTRGGHAKTAVVASCLFGSISGSPISNVATTGAFTIPTMKRAGYPAYFAGAVETAASCGGTIMPPVMGAVAFLMAEIIGVPYSAVVVSAFIPALLYYGAVFYAVDFEAIKQNLKGAPKEAKVSALRVLFKGAQYLLPLFWLVFRLFQGLSPSRSALEAVGCMIIIALISRNPKHPVKISVFIKSLVGAIYSLMPVALACASAGIVIGIITLTGLGAKFTSLIMALGHGMLFPALFLTMLVTIILGMGMSISPTYLLAASLAGPGLVNIGIPPMAAHLFILYFAAMATMTPPVSLAAYTAAGIADADPVKVGWAAVRIGIVAFVIPYVFVFRPEIILLSDNYLNAAISVFFTIGGVAALTCGINSYCFRPLALWEAITLLIPALILFTPYYYMNIAGLLLLAGIGFYFFKNRGKIPASALAAMNAAQQAAAEERKAAAEKQDADAFDGHEIESPASAADDLTDIGDMS